MGGNTQSIDITGYINTLVGIQTSNKLLDSAAYLDWSRWEEKIDEKKKVPSDVWHYYELNLTDSDFN
jgi:hypothetical protein